MNIVNINDVGFKDTDTYKNFMKDNPTNGCLKIRASLANEALPISNMNILITKDIDEYRIVFFEGKTDESGMINNINLPTPARTENDEIAPNFTTYDITATYAPENLDKVYNVSLCCSSCLVQYINVVPNTNLELEDNNGN